MKMSVTCIRRSAMMRAIFSFLLVVTSGQTIIDFSNSVLLEKEISAQFVIIR
jgi:hypothetical protein